MRCVTDPPYRRSAALGWRSYGYAVLFAAAYLLLAMACHPAGTIRVTYCERVSRIVDDGHGHRALVERERCETTWEGRGCPAPALPEEEVSELPADDVGGDA